MDSTSLYWLNQAQEPSRSRVTFVESWRPRKRHFPLNYRLGKGGKVSLRTSPQTSFNRTKSRNTVFTSSTFSSIRRSNMTLSHRQKSQGSQLIRSGHSYRAPSFRRKNSRYCLLICQITKITVALILGLCFMGLTASLFNAASLAALIMMLLYQAFRLLPIVLCVIIALSLFEAM